MKHRTVEYRVVSLRDGCCSGHNCGCQGFTVRQNEQLKRQQMPELVYVRLESRVVGAWKPWNEEKTR